ncbi:MAG: cyclopropane fatty acyl phospholipid synthase [Chlamydiales bacterium]
MIKLETSKKLVRQAFSVAGICLNGSNPWDLKIHDDRFYSQILRDGELAFGESYMEGWWDCHRIDLLTEKIIRSRLHKSIRYNTGFKLKALMCYLFNSQTKRKSKKVALQHYDIGNDLYQCMLDKNMNYSCAYWKHAKTLEQAQENKLEMICQKLNLKSGMKLLDIGCGFGGMAKHAAQHYGVEVVGVTISQEQQSYAANVCKDLPVEIKLQDYRDVYGEFDRVVSIGMFEHVGYKNYETFMKVVHRNLKEGGLCLLHTIGNNQSVVTGSPWILKYIFPNSMIPSIKQIGKAIENYFIMEDWHNFGQDYEKTLHAWHHNFNQFWDKIKHHYDDRFKRMWNFYLLYCAGIFRSRHLQLWQILLSKGGIESSYPVRDLIPNHNK